MYSPTVLLRLILGQSEGSNGRLVQNLKESDPLEQGTHEYFGKASLLERVSEGGMGYDVTRALSETVPVG